MSRTSRFVGIVRDGMMGEAFIGLYWTLPVNWAGFRSLPKDVDAAARASRSIRYQRAGIWRHLDSMGDRLAGELAVMDVRPDRATVAIRHELERARPGFSDVTRLVVVRIAEVHLWRKNLFLEEAVKAMGLQLVPLSPDPIRIDGELFDPIEHFRAWRQADAAAMEGFAIQVQAVLPPLLTAIQPGDGRWTAIAGRLNGQGIKTLRGGSWTAENVRKLAGRYYPDR